MRRVRARWWVAAAAALMSVGLAAPAQAATLKHSPPYRLGTFAGAVDQQQPRAFTGKIQFTVARGALDSLSFTVGALCGTLWVTDADSLPKFSVPIGSHGGFSYQGSIEGRQIRFYGLVSGHRATGKFFQSFKWGSESCSMGQAASFTAIR